MPFRLNSRKVFLTYPQAAPLTKTELFNWLRNKTVSNRSVSKLLVAEETHADGGVHFHCLIEYDGPVNVRSEREWDKDGKHPNIQSGRVNHVQYACKEDMAPMSHPEGWHLVHMKKSKMDEAYAAMKERVEAGDSLDQVFAAGTEKNSDLIRSYLSVTKWIESLIYSRDNVGRAAVHLPKYPIGDFNLEGADHARVLAFGQAVRDMQRGNRVGVRSLWLLGPSRYGKTALSRSIGDHWYMSSMWNIDAHHDGDGLYGVIDDWSWDQLKFNYKGLLGCQSDISVTDKYRKKRVIKHGYPVIVITNELPTFTDEERRWLDINVEFFEVVESMVPGDGDGDPTSWRRVEL